MNDHAIAILKISANNARTNAALHADAGDARQAALDLAVADDCDAAVAALKNMPA